MPDLVCLGSLTVCRLLEKKYCSVLPTHSGLGLQAGDESLTWTHVAQCILKKSQRCTSAMTDGSAQSPHGRKARTVKILVSERLLKDPGFICLEISESRSGEMKCIFFFWCECSQKSMYGRRNSQ